VTAAVREPVKHADLAGVAIALVTADAADQQDVSNVALENDVTVNATRSVGAIASEYLIKLNGALFTGLSEAGVHRLLTIGDTGTLEVAPGTQSVDISAFLEFPKPKGLAQRKALRELPAMDGENDCIYAAPPPKFVADGPRTGKCRIGRNTVLTGGPNNREISYADYAIDIIDEIESPQYHCERMVLAY